MFHEKSINSNTRIVLVETSKPWNVGAVARAIDNMGFSELFLVNPCNHLHEKAMAVASNSKHILHGATIVASLKEAISDCENVIATTARYRRHFQTYTSVYDLKEIYNPSQQTAIIFGRESSGLKNEELELCSHRLFIPAFGESTSLNLGQAVLLVMYEIRKLISQTPVSVYSEVKDKAAVNNLVSLREHFEKLLREIEFLKEENKNQVSNSLSDLLFRSNFTEKDIRILQGILRRTRKTIRFGKKSTRET